MHNLVPLVLFAALIHLTTSCLPSSKFNNNSESNKTYSSDSNSKSIVIPEQNLHFNLPTEPTNSDSTIHENSTDQVQNQTLNNNSNNNSIPIAQKFVLGSKRSDFVFMPQDLGIGHWKGEVLDQTVSKLNVADAVARLATQVFLDSEQNAVPLLAEWDYSGMNLPGNTIDGAGLARNGFSCFDSKQDCPDPEHGGQAFDRLMNYLRERIQFEKQKYDKVNGFISLTGHHYFQHYGAPLGARMVMSEIGENISSPQAHLAFTRGAARQFSTPWGMDMSPWYSVGMTDYWSDGERVWCQSRDTNGNCTFFNSSPYGGHSLSLTKRIWYLSFMAGANLIIQEGASVNFFTSPYPNASLSPMGLLAQEFYTFTKNNPDRGTPFVPFALVTDYYHGIGLHTFEEAEGAELTWNHFPIDEAGRRTLKLLNSLWPNSFKDLHKDESSYLVEAPLGETIDVLNDAVSAKTLEKYNVAFLTGNTNWTTQIKNIVWNSFLPQGKWLVIEKSLEHDLIYSDLGSPSLTTLIPGYSVEQIGVSSLNGGALVRIGDPSYYPVLMSFLRTNFLPFSIEGGASFALNRYSQTKWRVTLFNNYGISKGPLTPENIIPGQGRTISIKLNRSSLVSFKSVRGNREIRNERGILKVDIEQGDLHILDIDTLD